MFGFGSLNISYILQNIIETLVKANHNGFPVVEDVENKNFYLGLISRKYLLLLLKERVYIKKQQFSAKELRELFNGEHIEIVDVLDGLAQSDLEHTLDLVYYMTKSAYCVYKEFSADTSFELFRTMGLRQLPVVDKQNACVGIITRHEFAAHHIEHCHQKVVAKRKKELEPLTRALHRDSINSA